MEPCIGKDLTWEIRKYLELKQQNLADGIKQYLHEWLYLQYTSPKKGEKLKTDELHVQLKKLEKKEQERKVGKKGNDKR